MTVNNWRTPINSQGPQRSSQLDCGITHGEECCPARSEHILAVVVVGRAVAIAGGGHVGCCDGAITVAKLTPIDAVHDGREDGNATGTEKQTKHQNIGQERARKHVARLEHASAENFRNIQEGRKVEGFQTRRKEAKWNRKQKVTKGAGVPGRAENKLAAQNRCQTTPNLARLLSHDVKVWGLHDKPDQRHRKHKHVEDQNLQR